MMYFYVRGLIVFSFVVLAIIKAVFVVVNVKGQSMSPTLKHGDRVLVIRNWPITWLRNNQIVIVRPWAHSTHAGGVFIENLFLKRIVGMPGDTITTSINELDDFHRPRELSAHDSNGYRHWTIPPNHCFVYGDNVIRGFDSLSWGPIPLQCVWGLVIITLPK